MQKQCTRCGETKPASAFQRNRTHPDGLVSWCRTCRATHDAAYRVTHREEIATQRKAWRAANREKIASQKAAWYAAHREQAAVYRAAYQATHRKEKIAYEAVRFSAWRRANPELARLGRRAWDAVRHALKTGKLIKPTTCEQCGQQRQITAAHRDYSRVLDVRWLCRSCHSRWDHSEPKLMGATPSSS